MCVYTCVGVCACAGCVCILCGVCMCGVCVLSGGVCGGGMCVCMCGVGGGRNESQMSFLGMLPSLHVLEIRSLTGPENA